MYANLFSNAVKYTQEIIDHQGRPRKAVTYGREIIADFFGPAKPGIKFNVFTTGPHLSREEADFMFTEGGRARNSLQQEGTGHGLAFIKHVVELHGGQVGYEATNQGNNFYFILPMPAAALLKPVEVFEEAEEVGRDRRRGPRDRRRKGGMYDRRRKVGLHDRRRHKRR